MVDECSAGHKATNDRKIVSQKASNHLSNNMSQENSTEKGSSVCIGCGQKIYDQYILRVSPDLEWHAGCLKCFECCQFLDETCTCFVRAGKPYCKRDYVRLFAAKCSKCGKAFEKRDYVMRAKNNLYHTECFKCTMCMCPLLPGDEFALRQSSLFCKADYDLTERNGLRINAGELLEPYSDIQSADVTRTFPTHHDGESPIASEIMQGYLSVGHEAIGTNNASSGGGKNGALPLATNLRPVTTAVYLTNKSQASRDIPSAGSSQMTNSPQPSTSQRREKRDKPKTTRVRTVLNEKQLHTLRTCYAANPRPDALMKEQLVEMTGLSPRVIRVWFQNKRCKDKKKQLIMKQIQQQHVKNQTLNGIRMQGVGPIIASSPSRHDVPIISAIEIQQYHQNSAWMKTTTSNTMQVYSASLAEEIHPAGGQDSQTPFQQLMNEFGDSSMTTLNYMSTAMTYNSSSLDSELDTISPQLASSDMSSPSCSD